MTAEQPPTGSQPPTDSGPPGQPWYTQMWAIVAAIVAVVVIAIIVVVVALAGDDGDGNGDDEIAQASPTVEEPAGEASPIGDGAAGDGAAGDGAAGGGAAGDGAAGEALQDLKALASKAAEGVVAKVTYRYRSEVAGEVTQGEWVLVQRPPDSRFEISGTGGEGEFRSIVIISGGKSYICFSGGGSEICVATTSEEAEAGTAPFDPIFDIPQALAEGATDVELIETSERRIAGVDVTCFTIDAPDVVDEGEVCFSDDSGLLLRLAFEGSTFEATFVGEPTDEDFEPPFEVLDLGDLGDIEIPTP